MMGWHVVLSWVGELLFKQLLMGLGVDFRREGCCIAICMMGSSWVGAGHT